MIGIVVVSHSPALAAAAVELALEMVHGRRTGDRGRGRGRRWPRHGCHRGRRRRWTRAASPDGVLVLMDLGSAVLSAELALELVGARRTPVRLSSAPLVEGLVAAVVRAAGGADLDGRGARGRGGPGAQGPALAEHAAQQATTPHQARGPCARPNRTPRSG